MVHDPTHKFEGAISPGTEKAAKIISLIGQPPFLSIIPFVSICMAKSDDTITGLICSIVAIICSVILPIVNIMYFSRRYKNDDKLDVYRREDRMLPLVAGVIGYLIGVIALYFLDAPLLATVLMLCYACVTAAVAVITTRWKISIHSCGVIGPTMGLAMAFWPIGMLYILILPPVAWSRYVLGKHTPLQLIMGAVVGFIITALLFWIFLL